MLCRRKMTTAATTSSSRITTPMMLPTPAAGPSPVRERIISSGIGESTHRLTAKARVGACFLQRARKALASSMLTRRTLLSGALSSIVAGVGASFSSRRR